MIAKPQIAIALGRLVGALLTTLVFVFVGVDARAANYYVNDTATTNDQFCLQAWDGIGTGTAADPWSIGEFAVWVEGAGTQLNPGDTVFIDAGSHDIDSTSGIQIGPSDQGTTGSPVTIRGAILGTTRLSIVHDTAGTARERIWNLTGAYLVLQDMVVHTARNAGGMTTGDGVGIFAQTTSCNNLTLRNLEVYGCLANGIFCYEPTVNYNAAHIIEDCDIYGNDTDANADGAIRLQRARGVTIRRCRVHRNNSTGIHVDTNASFAGTPCTIEDCRVYSNLNATPGVWVFGGNDSVVIQRCFLYTNFQQLRLGDGTNGAATGCQVLNNILYANATGTDAAALMIANGSTGSIVKNNIIYASGTDIRGIYLPTDEGGTFNYNCIYAVSNAWAGATNGSLPGLTFAGWQATGRDTNSINKDPRFVDLAGADLVLGDPPGAPDEGRDDDVHEVSTFGYFTNSGGPFFDRNYDSPTIDIGDPADPFVSETGDNGGRINAGMYGATAEAARSGDPSFTNTWTGWSILHGSASSYAANSSWNDPNNWSRKTVPSSTHNMLVPDRSAVDEDPFPGTQPPLPPQVDVTTTVNGVYVGDTANVYNGGAPTAELLFTNLTNYTLTASGAAGLGGGQTDTFQVSSTGRVTLVTGTAAVTSGNLRVDVGGTLLASSATANGTVNAPLSLAGTLSVTTSGGNVNLQGNVSSIGTMSFAAGTTCTFRGSAVTQSISHTGGGSYVNLTVNKSSGIADFTSNLTVTGTLTITSGAMRLGTPGVICTLQGLATVGSSGTLLMENTTTLKFNQAAPSVTSPQLTVDGRLKTIATGATPPILTRDADASNAVTVSIAGTADINGVTLNRLGSIAGPPAVEGLQIESGATVANLNQVSVGSSSTGVNFLKTSGAYTMRSCRFDASVIYNVKVPTGVPGSSDLSVTLENASGAKGDMPNGEGNDVDPYDGTVNPPDGRIAWVYFEWKWIGGSGTNLWDEPVQANDLANWTWQGVGPRPSDFPNSSSQAVWIASATDACNQNGSFSVKDISITTGATLTEGGAGAFTLSINGTAIKSGGATFNAGDGTVTLAGTTTQSVIMIGGSGTFWNFTIGKTSGTAGELGADLTVDNDVNVSTGDLDLKDYTLTAKGNVTVAAATNLKVGGISRLYVNNGAVAKTLSVSGTLEVSVSGAVDLGDSGAGGAALTVGGASGARRLRLLGSGQVRSWDGGESISFDSGSTFETTGSPTVTRQTGATGGYAFSMNSGSTLEVTALSFSYAGANGFTINSGAVIGNFANVSFANVVGGGTRRHLGIGVGATLTLPGMSFDFTFDNPPGTGSNVEALTGSNGFTYLLTQWTQTGLSDPDARDLDSSESPGTRATVSWGRTLTWVGKWAYYRTIPVGAAVAGQYVFVRLNSTTTPTAATLLAGMVALTADELRVLWWDASAGTATSLARNVPTFVTSPAGSERIEVHLRIPAGFDFAADQIRLYYGASSPSAGPALSDSESPKTLFSDDFETGSLVAGGWTFPDGAGPSTTASDVYAGTYCALVTNAVSGTKSIRKDITGGSVGYYTVQVQFFRKAANVTDPGGATNDTFVSRYSTNGWVGNTAFQTDSLAVGVTAGWNAAGSPYSPAAIENQALLGIDFQSIVDATSDRYRVDNVSVRGYKGDIVLTSGTVLNAQVNVTFGGATVEGYWDEPIHWSPVAVPGPADDIVINGGYTYSPNVSVASTVLSVSLGTSAASELRMSGPANDLTTTGSFILGSSGTIFWPLVDAGTSEENGSINIGQDFDVRGGTLSNADDMFGTDGTPTSYHVLVGRDLLVSGDTAELGAQAANIEVNVRRNIVDTAANWQFGGVVRMVGEAAGDAAIDTFQVTMASASRIRLFEVSMDIAGESGDIVRPNSSSQIGAERVRVRRGVLEAPSTTTVRVEDVAGMTSGGEEGVVRFLTADANTARRARVNGGTLLCNRVGVDVATSGNGGTFELSSGTVTISTNAFAGSGGLYFINSNATPGQEPSVLLSGGTLNLALNWSVLSAGGIAPSFSSTGGTVVFNGTAAQSITHSPASTPSFSALQVGEGANGPNALTLANDIACVDLDIVEGVFAPGAGRTATKTGAVVTDIQAGGTLQLANGTVLKLASGASIGVNSGGTLSTTGTSAAGRARIENSGAGTYSFSVAGTMNVNYLTISNIAATGLVVNNTATLTGWTGVRFASGAAGGMYLDLSGATVATTLPSTMSLCQFDAGPTNNVKGAGGAATHSNLTFSNWAGALGGEQFETNDTLDLVDWGSGASVVLRTINPLDPDVAVYATLQDAINDATAGNNVIEVRDNVIRDETLNLSALGFRIVIDGAVLRPPGASIAIVGSGAPAREVLRNVVLIRDVASVTPLLQDVANIIHCDVLGAFTTANPLITVNAASACLIESSIVGDPATWQADGDDPISNAGALTVNYSFADRGVVYAGTNNSNANPQLQNWDPITGGSGLYDVHLKPGSPCVDYAPAPSIAVATDFDRGLDFNSADQDPGGSNPRRPINARPDVTDGGGPYASWDDDFGVYDVGADELGPLVTGTGNKAQGVPLWTIRAGTGIVSDPDSFSLPIATFSFSPAMMYVGENNNVSLGAGRDIRLVAYDMNDADSDGDLDIVTTLNLTGNGVQKIHEITALGGGTQDNLYLVVDTTSDADTMADAILAVQYTPSPPTLALRGAWGTNPVFPAGAGTTGRIVIGQADGRLYFPRGDGRLYRRNATDGTAPAATGNWLATGQLDLSASGYDGKIDAEGSLFAGKFNNSLYIPTSQHASEIIRVQMADGSLTNFQSCGAGNRNHFGFHAIAQSIFVTGADQYVWRVHEDTLAYNAWPAAVWPWESEPMGATVRTTTKAQMFRTLDAHVRVGTGASVYKFRKDTGVIADDSDAAADDWGPGRTFRGNILTAPAMIGGTGKDYTPVADGRRCAKLVFGTDQGYCYVTSYIRATLATDAEENGEPQPASSSIVGYDIPDGRPYPGYPYRIPGVKIVYVTFLSSSTVGKQVILFFTDNGWVYGFIEPY